VRQLGAADRLGIPEVSRMARALDCGP